MIKLKLTNDLVFAEVNGKRWKIEAVPGDDSYREDISIQPTTQEFVPDVVVNAPATVEVAEDSFKIKINNSVYFHAYLDWDDPYYPMFRWEVSPL